MCGIAGICGIQSPVFPDTETISTMLAAIRHRGPDQAGVYLDDWAALGHCRLSIIDLAGGIQPLSNETGELWITYNGEIFNYPELKEELVHSHQFKTKTDTEVLLHLFEEKGFECLNKLNGQFAFGIWNSKKRELFLARDRVGIRPLFYTIHNDKLIFGSEIKALFQHPGVIREINPRGLDQIFTFWTTLPGYTVFREIHQLKPGHYLYLKNGNITIKQYWDAPFNSDLVNNHRNYKSTVEELDELLTDSIRIRLRADVPVGTYLSGGLDSSGITSKIVNKFDNQLHTFGVRFENKDFDETDFQRTMVQHLNTKHTEIIASDSEVAENFPQVIYHAETPMTRTAPVPLFLLSKIVRNLNYKVVLTGEGADEFFGGYNIFRETKIREFWSRQPESNIRANLIGQLYPYIFKDQRLKKMLQTFFARGMQNTANPFYSHFIRWDNTSRIKLFFSKDFHAKIAGYDATDDLYQHIPSGFSNFDSLSKAQYLESTLFMSNYLLSSQGDRVAMANSIEIRMPFLDYRIIEYLSTIPSRWKISGIKEKFILKKIFEKELPYSILKRQKHPYRAPIDHVLTNKYLEGFIAINKVKEYGIFDHRKVSALLENIKTDRKTSELDSMALCLIMSTQILYRKFIKKDIDNTKASVDIELIIDKRTNKKKHCNQLQS